MNQAEPTTITEQLCSLFLTSAKAVARRISEHGLALTMPVSRLAIERDQHNPGAWRSHERQEEQNVLTAGMTGPQLAPLLPPEAVASITQIASMIIVEPNVRLPFWSPFAGSTWLLVQSAIAPDHGSKEYNEDPIAWTVEHLLLPALYSHLSKVPNLELADFIDGQRFAQEVVEVATASDLSYLITVPLAGFDTGQDNPLNVDDKVRIRRLSPDEQGEIWQTSGTGVFPNTQLPLAALEILIPTVRDAQYADFTGLAADWICAFQLCGYDISGEFASFRSVPRWRMSALSRWPLTLARNFSTDWPVLSDDDAQKIAAVVRRLGKFNITQPKSPADLALHRFRLGASRSAETDAVLDFVIALESLLLPYDEYARHGDLGYRFRLHGAHYIGHSPNERREVAKGLDGLYGLRSRLVHGGRYPDAGEISAGKKVAKDYARRGLIRALKEGFPTAKDFRDTLLGMRAE